MAGKPYRRKQDNMWCVSIELTKPGGKRNRKVVVAKYKADALAEYNRLMKAYGRNGDMPTKSPTVEQWITYWLEHIVPEEVRPKTAANYRTFGKHIIRELGPIKVDRVTPADVRRADASIKKALSATSAATAHRIMSSAFSKAMEEGKMTSNPARIAKAPKLAATQLEVLTYDETLSLLSQFDDGTEKVMWFTFLLTGARRGEVLGLQWDRVDEVLDFSWQLQRHTVEMVAPDDYEYDRLEGGLYLTRPKSKAGWRIVPLVPPLSDVLSRWREIAPANPHNLLFAREDGSPFDPDAISKMWPKVLANAGIDKRIRIHDLRHGTVDRLYEAGISEQTISEIVGHSSRSMTRAYKSRGNRPQLTDAMLKLSALLAPQ